MTIPDDIRRAVIYQVLELHKPVAVVAAELRISLRSAERFLSYQRVHGDIHPNMETRGVHKDNVRRHEGIREAVCAAVEAYPEAFLDEAAVFVNEVQDLMEEDVRVSPESVRRVLAANGFTRKVIETNFRQRNEAARAAWVATQWAIPLHCRVYLDEAHRRGRAANRRWAWSLRGGRAESYVDASKGVATSFIVAMAHGGLIDWKLTKPPPGQSSVDFLLFLINSVLPAMSAYNSGLSWDQQEPNCVLILDNARVHDHIAVVVVEAAGVMVRFLPPYSPDFNPVEDVFSVGSSWLRRHVTSEQFSVWRRRRRKVLVRFPEKAGELQASRYSRDAHNQCGWPRKQSTESLIRHIDQQRKPHTPRTQGGYKLKRHHTDRIGNHLHTSDHLAFNVLPVR